MTGCDPSGRCAGGQGRISLTCAVRYGCLGYVGEFKYGKGSLKRCGVKAVIQTNRGIEIGEVISLTCTGCEASIDRQQMVDYAKRSGAEAFQLRAGCLLREASPQDLQEEAKINAGTAKKLDRARELAADRKLPMKFIACEHVFGGERIIFHFMSESRIDFRDLVRDLAHEYLTRIEMHQVGSRDEARLVADYEICGRECCCRNFLKKLRPVTMRMAKLQKATLDPSKVSGRCGRLRCCLRYEHEGYEELNKKLPRVGSRVRTERGIGTVKDRHILTQLLTIVYDDGNIAEEASAEDILEKGLPKRPPAPPPGTESPRGATRPSRRERPRREKVTETASTGGKQDAKDEADGRPQSDGRRRRGKRRRPSQKRSGVDAAAPVDAQEAPSVSREDGPVDEAAGTGPPAGVAGAGPPATGDQPSESPSATNRKRRGRRGRRRKRRSDVTGDSSGQGASGGASNDDSSRGIRD